MARQKEYLAACHGDPTAEHRRKAPEFANSLSSLALLYWRRGDYAKAQSLLDQGLELTAANQGENHPSYAFYLNNVAELQRQQGNFATAEPLYRQALDIQRRVLGEDHPALSATLGNLALLTAATNRLPDSLAFHLQAAAIDDRLIGEVFSVASERERMSISQPSRASSTGFYRCSNSTPLDCRAAWEWGWIWCCAAK